MYYVKLFLLDSIFCKTNNDHSKLRITEFMFGYTRDGCECERVAGIERGSIFSSFIPTP